MSKKTRVNFTIDPIVELQFNARVADRQRSQLIENFMRTYTQTQGYQSLKETELRKRKQELEEQAQTILGEISTITIQLQSMEEQKMKEGKEKAERAIELAKTLKANNVYDQVAD